MSSPYGSSPASGPSAPPAAPRPPSRRSPAGRSRRRSAPVAGAPPQAGAAGRGQAPRWGGGAAAVRRARRTGAPHRPACRRSRRARSRRAARQTPSRLRRGSTTQTSTCRSAASCASRVASVVDLPLPAAPTIARCAAGPVRSRTAGSAPTTPITGAPVGSRGRSSRSTTAGRDRIGGADGSGLSVREARSVSRASSASGPPRPPRRSGVGRTRRALARASPGPSGKRELREGDLRLVPGVGQQPPGPIARDHLRLAPTVLGLVGVGQAQLPARGQLLAQTRRGSPATRSRSGPGGRPPPVRPRRAPPPSRPGRRRSPAAAASRRSGARRGAARPRCERPRLVRSTRSPSRWRTASSSRTSHTPPTQGSAARPVSEPSPASTA